MPSDDKNKSDPLPEIRPDWAEKGAARDRRTFDARAILAGGLDPFHQIMDFMEDLPGDEDFAVEASFNPQPLRRLLAARGYASYGEQLEADYWRILFHPETVVDNDSAEAEAAPRTWNEEKTLHVDLRRMEPPGPLVFILGLLDRPGMGKEVVVHLDQDPIYLYPELNERSWDWERLESDETEFRLRLFRPVEE